MGFVWLHADAFLHCVASPFHNFVTTSILDLYVVSSCSPFPLTPSPSATVLPRLQLPSQKHPEERTPTSMKRNMHNSVQRLGVVSDEIEAGTAVWIILAIGAGKAMHS